MGDDGCDEVAVCGVADVGLVVACCDATEFLDLGEVVFDQMSPAVHVLVVGRRPLPVGERGNDGACATLVQLLSQPAGIECLVGDEGIEVNVVDQRLERSVSSQPSCRPAPVRKPTVSVDKLRAEACGALHVLAAQLPDRRHHQLGGGRMAHVLRLHRGAHGDPRQVGLLQGARVVSHSQALL